ncbi:MAG: efflux RND transporter periplasmic adaptor subunit [Xanthomonadales bacterium]|nr:efflux RND transporter periplasmic adaptor subunit [Xanthomonadales bacterium]
MNSHIRTIDFFRSCLLVALICTALVACGGPQGGPDKGDQAAGPHAKSSKVTVEVSAASRQPVSASYHATATLDAPNEAQVVAKTSGVLLRLMVEEGDQVKAGQVLAKIDPERSQLEVRRAEALLHKLEADLARSKELFERKLVAADAYEKIRYDVETQRAVYDMARLELSYTDITAPISGVVAQRMAKVGNLIQLNSGLFRIVDTSRLEATLNVPERELGTMQVGAPVSLAVVALPSVDFQGTIDRISPVIDAGSGTFRVVCNFKPDARLRAGMFGRISVVFDQREDVLTVPRVALIDDGEAPAVFRIQDGKAVRTPVEVGYLGGDVAEIRSGLTDGDQVVTTGKLALRDGAEVEVIGGDTAVAGASTGSNSGTTEY